MVSKKSKRTWCVTDLFLEPATGRLSQTRLWTNVGNGILTLGMLRTIYHAAFTYDLVLAYGAIVCGNRLAMELIKRKTGSVE